MKAPIVWFLSITLPLTSMAGVFTNTANNSLCDIRCVEKSQHLLLQYILIAIFTLFISKNFINTKYIYIYDPKPYIFSKYDLE